MTTAQRLTGADWRVWFRLLVGAGVRGAALGVKASGLLGAASAVTTEKWAASTVDLKLIGAVAISGLIYGFVDFLVEKSLPTGSESDDETKLP